MKDLRLYFRLVSVSIKSQMEYRASFLMTSFGNFLLTGIDFVGVWVLFSRFGKLKDWSLPEAAILYGIINMGFALSEAVFRGFDTFDRMVKSGDFDRVLLRPRNTVIQILGQELQMMRIGRFSQGLAVILWGGLKLKIFFSIPCLALLLFAILGSAALFSGLFVLQATLSFWTIDSLEIVNTVTYGGVETAQFPLSIYNRWFRGFFTFVIPLACINYFPAHAILGKKDVLGYPEFFGWVSPFFGFAFLWFCFKIWEFGVRNYKSTGS
ncbi:ABC-2 family transporter protein [bacterium]|nr:ABC-2 family transporter protein [bacterium]